MSNHWKQKDIPHKGWNLIDVIDVREDEQEEWETEYEICMMCGNEKIRYVHILLHGDVDDELRVGCICAEKMTSDYYTPKHREQALKNRANRRANWIKKEWKISKKGNPYLKKDDHLLTIFKGNSIGKFRCKIDYRFGTVEYDSIAKAKTGLFNKVEEMKQKGKW